MESILITIKKLLGIEADYDHFDADLIIFINSVFPVLSQLGVGPAGGFLIMDDSATWDDYIPDSKNLSFIKSFIHLKVKLIFDPPESSAAIKSIEEQIDELEWRINVAAESPKPKGEEDADEEFYFH